MKTKYLYLVIALLLSVNGISGTTVKEVSTNKTSITEKLFVAYNNGIPEYYYSDINHKSGSSKSLKTVNVRIYWDIWGNFIKLGLNQNQNLNKINNESFSTKDYERLHFLLNDLHSGIQYYKFDNYSAEKSEQQYYNVDAMSGATVVDASYDCVKGAVKTCYDLYKFTHGDMVSTIVKNTKSSLQNMPDEVKLNKVASKVINNEKVTSPFLNTVADSDEKNSVAYISSAIELARQSRLLNKEFNTWLETCFINSNNTKEKTIIYNYLIQNGYKTKAIRSYQVEKTK